MRIEQGTIMEFLLHLKGDPNSVVYESISQDQLKPFGVNIEEAKEDSSGLTLRVRLHPLADSSAFFGRSMVCKYDEVGSFVRDTLRQPIAGTAENPVVSVDFGLIRAGEYGLLEYGRSIPASHPGDKKFKFFPT